jgi:hypothetical protein
LIAESALYLNQSVNIIIIVHIFLNFIYSLDDVLDGAEDAFASDHVTDGKYHGLLVF